MYKPLVGLNHQSKKDRTRQDRTGQDETEWDGTGMKNRDPDIHTTKMKP